MAQIWHGWLRGAYDFSAGSGQLDFVNNVSIDSTSGLGELMMSVRVKLEDVNSHRSEKTQILIDLSFLLWRKDEMTGSCNDKNELIEVRTKPQQWQRDG